MPIIPVTYLNNWILLPDDYSNGGGRPGIARIIVHEPIDTKGMTDDDVDALSKRVREIIEAPVKEKYPEYFGH